MSGLSTIQGESSLWTISCSESTSLSWWLGGSASRHGSLNSFSPVAWNLPSLVYNQLQDHRMPNPDPKWCECRQETTKRCFGRIKRSGARTTTIVDSPKIMLSKHLLKCWECRPGTTKRCSGHTKRSGWPTQDAWTIYNTFNIIT